MFPFLICLCNGEPVATSTADRIRCGRARAGRNLRLTSGQLPLGQMYKYAPHVCRAMGPGRHSLPPGQ